MHCAMKLQMVALFRCNLDRSASHIVLGYLGQLQEAEAGREARPSHGCSIRATASVHQRSTSAPRVDIVARFFPNVTYY